jgi:hypothetical protein
VHGGVTWSTIVYFVYYRVKFVACNLDGFENRLLCFLRLLLRYICGFIRLGAGTGKRQMGGIMVRIAIETTFGMRDALSV